MPTLNYPGKDFLLKTLWEKEKMLVTSIFSFSYNGFYPIKEKINNLSNIEIALDKAKIFLSGIVLNL